MHISSRPVSLTAPAAGTLAAFALFLLARGYEGPQHDGVLYFGQALVRERAPVLQQDPFFSGGSQDAFSLYSRIVAPLYDLMGIAATHQALLLLGLVGSALALILLLRRLGLGNWSHWGLLAVAVLSPLYGGKRIFSYTEPFLTARSLAEPLLIASLVALARGGLRAAALLQVAALALHPLMALPACVVTWLLAVSRDRRWLLTLLLVPIALLLGQQGVAPLDRLLQAYDPFWWSMVSDLNLQVVLSNWDLRDWWVVITDAALLGGAAQALAPNPQGRRLVIALLTATGLLLAASFAGTVASYNVLITQLQLWRVLWLTHLLATAIAPWLLWRLWHQGGLWRVSAGFIVLLLLDGQTSAGHGGPLLLGWLLCAMLAVKRVAISEAVQRLLLGLCLLSALWYCGAHLLLQLERLYWRYPASGIGLRVIRILTEPLVAAGLAGLLALWCGRGRLMARLAVTMATLGLLGAAVSWDRRDDLARVTEAPGAHPPLAAQIPPSATVFWPDNVAATWGMLGRVSHYSSQQRAGMLFNRATALAIAPLRNVYLRIDEARKQCEMGAALGGTPQTLAACATPAPALLRELCGGTVHPDFLVFATPLPVAPLSTWSTTTDRYSLYRCGQFQGTPTRETAD